MSIESRRLVRLKFFIWLCITLIYSSSVEIVSRAAFNCLLFTAGALEAAFFGGSFLFITIGLLPAATDPALVVDKVGKRVATAFYNSSMPAS